VARIAGMFSEVCQRRVFLPGLTPLESIQRSFMAQSPFTFFSTTTPHDLAKVRDPTSNSPVRSTATPTANSAGRR
jgi:hypothetical protein